MVSKESLASITLLGVSVIWGGTFPLIKIAIQESSPFAFIFLRFLIATLVLASGFRKQLRSTSKEALQAGFLIGIFIFIGYATQTVGLKYTTASKSGFITGLYVVFTPIISYSLMKTRLPRIQTLAVVQALVGLFLMSEIDPSGLDVNFGDFLTLLCAIAFAFSVVLISKYVKKFNSSILATTQTFAICIFCMLLWIIIEPGFFPTSTITWIAILITAIFATSAAFLAQNFAQEHTTANRAAIIFTAEPVFALFFSHLALGESLSLKGMLGAFLIVSGMLMSELRGKY